MFTRIALFTVLALALLFDSHSSEASHPYADPDTNPPRNYLYRDLEAPIGDNQISYSEACVNPAPEWDIGVENWDTPLTRWLFNPVTCGSMSADNLFRWEVGNECAPAKGACVLDPSYFIHGSHGDVANQRQIVFDSAKYNPSATSSNIWLSAHEWGHVMGLADHEGDDICDIQPTSIMDTDPDSLCPQSPTIHDLNSVNCNVYKLCAGVRVAVGNVTGDACEEIITAPGPGPDPWVRVWGAPSGCITPSSALVVKAQFNAYALGFEGGVYIATGNVYTSTGYDEIITGAGAGGGPHVRVWRVETNGTGTPLSGFFPYGSFTGGVRVSAGDLNCAAGDEILTTHGSGRNTTVDTWNSSFGLLGSILPYGTYLGGAFVAGGNIETAIYCGDEIVTGADAGGGAHVKTWCCYDGSAQFGNWFPYGQGFAGGVRVATSNVGEGVFDPPHEIVTGPGPGGGPHVRVYNTNGGEIWCCGFMAYDPGFTGGIYVAGGQVNGIGPSDVVTGAGEGGAGHVRIWNCCTLPITEIKSFFAY